MLGDPDIFREAEAFAHYEGQGEDDDDRRRPEPEPDAYDRADQEYNALVDAHLAGEHLREPSRRCAMCLRAEARR